MLSFVRPMCMQSAGTKLRSFLVAGGGGKRPADSRQQTHIDTHTQREIESLGPTRTSKPALFSCARHRESLGRHWTYVAQQNLKTPRDHLSGPPSPHGEAREFVKAAPGLRGCRTPIVPSCALSCRIYFGPESLFGCSRST